MKKIIKNNDFPLIFSNFCLKNTPYFSLKMVPYTKLLFWADFWHPACIVTCCGINCAGYQSLVPWLTFKLWNSFWVSSFDTFWEYWKNTLESPPKITFIMFLPICLCIFWHFHFLKEFRHFFNITNAKN